MVGDLITNFNSSYANKFSFEPGRGHVIGRLCIRLVVFLLLCILKLFFNIRNIDFGLLKPNFGYQP